MKNYSLRGALCISALSISALCMGQNENPRGIYKMTHILYTDSAGKDVLIPAPNDQYKICTDHTTLTLRVMGGKLRMGEMDDVFNYTGAHHENENDSTALIFDSDANGFKLKWFSHETGIPHFPYRTWCTEYYEAGHFSPEARKYFDLLETEVQRDKKNPFIGTWEYIGQLDELKNAKKNITVLYKEKQERNRTTDIYIFTQEYEICSSSIQVFVYDIEYKGKTKIMDWQGRDANVKWITDDCFAMPFTDRFGHSDWYIYYRKEGSTPLQDVLSVRDYWNSRPYRRYRGVAKW